ncbi:uncharacterized protein PFB0145c-like [Anneissia japonica]|uniref:uncharacterized protein PFB0145c-like n=1 Tax=Anneissia japonica TaxID=1529436 RepID=UPI0014259B01|nr:uncharacterized protein PFB0145c-like [Anneissia japonica]
MDSAEELHVGLSEDDGVIVKGFQIFNEKEQTIRGIIEAFQQAPAVYKVCGIIYPVGTKKDRAVVKFSSATAKELIDIRFLKIGKKTKLKIEKIKTFRIGKIFSIRIDPVVACLLPNLKTIHCGTEVQYVDHDEEHYFVSDSKECLQIVIDSIIEELRKTLLERKSDRVQLSATTPSSGEDHSDCSSCESFVIISEEDFGDVTKHSNIIACSVVNTSIDSKICNWKDEVVKFLQNLKCENVTIVYTAEDHAIAVFNDEEGANRLMSSHIHKSPIRCSRLKVPGVVDEKKLIRVEQTISALLPDIVYCFKQTWNVITLNGDEFIIDFNYQQILPKLAEYVKQKLIKKYSSCPESTSQASDSESQQIPNQPDNDFGTNSSHSDKKESINGGKDEIKTNKSAECVSEELESTIGEQCKRHGLDEKDKTPNQSEPIQTKSSKICNSQGKKRKSSVTEEEAQIQDEDSIENCDNPSSKDGIIKRHKKVDAPQNLPAKCNIAEGNKVSVQNYDTQKEQARDQMNDKCCHISESEDITGKIEDTQGQHGDQNIDTEGKRQKYFQDDHHTRQDKIEKENRDDQGQQSGQNKDAKGKMQIDSQDHHKSQSQIDKEESRHDEVKHAGQNRDTNGKQQNDSQDHHTSQSEIAKENTDNQDQQAGQNKDTKDKRQKDSHDHDTSPSEIEKENTDNQGQQAGQNKDIKDKRRKDSQDHHTSPSEISKENRDDSCQHAGQNKDTKVKRRRDSQDCHTCQSAIEKVIIDDQVHKAGQNKDSKSKKQKDSQDHHISQYQQAGQNKGTEYKKQKDSQDYHISPCEIEKDNRDVQDQQAGQNKDLKEKKQNNPHNHHTSQIKIKESKDDEVKHAGQNINTKDKSQNDSKDHHTSQSGKKENKDDQGHHVGQNEDKKGKGQQDYQKNLTSQSKMDKEENEQKKIDGRKKQGNGQHHQAKQRLDNDGGKVKPTAEKKHELKQSQKDKRINYLTVHNEVYQFLKQFQEMKLKKIERNYNVSIKWMKDETQQNLVVLSNIFNDEERMTAENEFIQLYQDVSNSVKLQNIPVQNHKSSDIKQSLKRTMQESKNVLLLHKDNNVLFIGDENDVTQAKKIFKGLLGIPAEEKRLKKSVKETEKSSGSSSKITVGKGVKVIVRQADITSEDVDVIVNAANSRLKHDGGVAKAIAVKAGRALDVEGQRKLRERGSALNVSEVLHTGGYNLNAKYVLHAVGPIRQHANWHKHDQFYQLLKDTFFNCLEYADEELKAKRIAIPLISSGNFGGGKRECAKALATSVNDFAQIDKLRSLKEIRLVNIDAEATQEIQTQIDAIRDVPRSQCIAVAGNINNITDLSNAVIVNGFKVCKSLEETKLNLVMLLLKCTYGKGRVLQVIYPVEKLPRKAIIIFEELRIAKPLIDDGESTTNTQQNLLFQSIEVGIHWEASILDLSMIPSSIFNRFPVRCEDLGGGRLLLESQQSTEEIETYFNNELEKWLNTQVDGVDQDSSVHCDAKGKFSISQCVIVTGFEEFRSQATTRDKLLIFLSRQKYGGGDVEGIVYPFGNSTKKAMVIFSDTKVARSLIEASEMSDGKGQSLEIYPFKKYRKVDLQHLQTLLHLAPWCAFMDENDAENSWEGFMVLIEAAIHNSIPKIRKRCKHRSP